MKLVLRIAAILLLVLGFGVGLAAFLSQAKFERTLEDLVRSRLQVVAADLSHTVEGALRLGLALDEARNIPDAIALAAASDSEILWIGIRPPEGPPLFSTGPEPPADTGLAVSAGITNAFGQSAGTVTVIGSRAAVSLVTDRTLERLGLIAVIAVALATAIGALVSGLLLKDVVRHFSEARRAIEAMQKGRTPEVADPPPGAPALDRDFTAFRVLARRAFVDLYRAERTADGAPPDGASTAGGAGRADGKGTGHAG